MPKGRFTALWGSLDGRISGAAVAVTMLGAALAILAVAHPYGIDIPAGWDPSIIVAAAAFVATLGWWAGRAATRGGSIRAALVGGGIGVAWWPVAVLVLVTLASVHAVLRGASPAVDGAAPLIWALYGLAIGIIFASAIGVPSGVVWGVLTRAVARRADAQARPGGRIRRPTVAAVGALLCIAITTGASLAITDGVPGQRCLDLGGARPLDGSFSPAGDMLVVITSNDRNAGGTIHLLDWPSGLEIDRWESWVDQDVVVDPRGRVYWSAWEYQDPWRGGVMTVASGSAPRWLATDESEALWSLVWTSHGLRGMTANGHQAARIRLVPGLDAGPRFMVVGPAIGIFWASPDDRVSITAAEWSADSVSVKKIGESPVEVPISGDPRAVAMSADRSRVIVATWFGGTRQYDVATGRSRDVLPRSQSWIAVSAHDEIAWADDEQFGSGRVCVAPLPE